MCVIKNVAIIKSDYKVRKRSSLKTSKKNNLANKTNINRFFSPLLKAQDTFNSLQCFSILVA